MKKIVVIGGGAAGFFAALAAKEANPRCEVVLIEKTSQLLGKVRISGGGRCNVTHACFDPKELVKNYPRGSKELLGPFHNFQPADTIRWFESRGVTLKTEEDGRMFPDTDSSETIIACLLSQAAKLGVAILTKKNISRVDYADSKFILTFDEGSTLECTQLIVSSGSHPSGFRLAQQFGHTIQEPVPSLFTFNVPTSPLKELSGISTEKATLSMTGSSYKQTGPLLITHWGFSGPAALKLSAWAARWLKEKEYRAELNIDWIPEISQEDTKELLKTLRGQCPGQTLANHPIGKLPKNLWKKLLELSGAGGKRLSEIGNEQLNSLSSLLKRSSYQVEGKTTNKDEFVTCGGVTLNEINLKSMESKKTPGLYFAGEVIDVDAVTGGFNFQNAWTTGWIAGRAAARDDVA